MSPRGVTRQPPGLPCLHRRARALLRTSGVSAHESQAPRAFHGFDQGMSARCDADRTCSEGSIAGQRVIGDTTTEGLDNELSPFFAPGAPLPRRRRSAARSRPSRPRPSLDVTPSSCLAAFLGRGAKMPRIRFYNRRSRHEHPRGLHLWRLARRPSWETRRRSTSRQRGNSAFPPLLPCAAPDHLTVIRPPAAPRLTARRRLRADRLPPTHEAG